MGQPAVLALLPNLEIGWAKSGVNGPLTWGSKVERSISTNWKKNDNNKQKWKKPKKKTGVVWKDKGKDKHQERLKEVWEKRNKDGKKQLEYI